MRAALIFLCCVLLQPPASASSRVHILVLWSWKPAGQSWHYTFTPYDPDHVDYAAVVRSRDVCVGETALETRIASLPPNYHALWQQGPRATQLRLPPEALRNRIIAFAQKHGVHIEPNPIFED
jgi:hypothetical protein